MVYKNTRVSLPQRAYRGGVKLRLPSECSVQALEYGLLRIHFLKLSEVTFEERLIRHFVALFDGQLHEGMTDGDRTRNLH